MLDRENRSEIAKKAFEFLPTRAHLDSIFGENVDIFAHKIES